MIKPIHSRVRGMELDGNNSRLIPLTHSTYISNDNLPQRDPLVENYSQRCSAKGTTVLSHPLRPFSATRSPFLPLYFFSRRKAEGKFILISLQHHPWIVRLVQADHAHSLRSSAFFELKPSYYHARFFFLIRSNLSCFFIPNMLMKVYQVTYI